MKSVALLFHILARTFAMSSLLRIFPEADLGTLFMNVTLLNLLKGATCNRVKKEEYMIIDVTRITQPPAVNHFCTLYYQVSKQEIWFRKKKWHMLDHQTLLSVSGNVILLRYIVSHYLFSNKLLNIFFGQWTVGWSNNICYWDLPSFSVRKSFEGETYQDISGEFTR